MLACAMLVLQPAQTLFAQENQSAPQQEATPSPYAVAEALDSEPAFTMEDLRFLAAPIALYPDSLLIQVLVASTYPLDVVRAHRFLQQNVETAPEVLVELAEQEGWDPSLIALVPFPTVIERMATDLNWTEELGDAMTMQSEDLLDAVQDLREEAEAAGALESNEYQTVSREEGDMIAIMPAEPEKIYVPVYNTEKIYVSQPVARTTTVVTGSGYSNESMVATGIVAFTAGILIGNYFGRKDRYDYYWGTPYRPVSWHSHKVYPPYYRSSSYRPPYYRPMPPGYRPGDAWRPRPELYRDAKVRVSTRRAVTRNVNRNLTINDARKPSATDRTKVLEKQLKDRGRDTPGAKRPSVPQRPATRDTPRIGTGDKPALKDRGATKPPAFDKLTAPSDVRKNRDRGQVSVDRSTRPATSAIQAPTAKRPKINPKPTAPKPQLKQRPQAQQQIKRPAAPAFQVQPGSKASNASSRGRTSLQRR
jgi:hypothetical protein